MLNSTLSLYGALHRQSVVTIVLEMIRYVCDGAEMHESNFRLVLNKRCDHETDNYCYDAPATISEAYSDCSCLSVYLSVCVVRASNSKVIESCKKKFI